MKYTISRKLFTGFFTVLFILIATVALSYHQISSVDSTYSELINDRAAKVVMIKDLVLEIKREQVFARDYLLGDESAFDKFYKSRDKYEQQSAEFEKILILPETKQNLQELNELEKEYADYVGGLFKLKKQNKTAEYEALLPQDSEITGRFSSKAKEITDVIQASLVEGKEDTSQQVKTTKNWILGLGLISVFAALFIAFYMSRLISNPIKSISNEAKRIASGDLASQKLNIKNKDEIGELSDSFHQMAMNIRRLIQQVGLNAEQVAAASEQLSANAEQTSKATEQISSTMQQVAAGTENQARSAEETSRTVNEMSIGIKQISENSQQVSHTAAKALDKAGEGNQSIQTAVDQMNSINNTVHRLGEVISSLGRRSKEIGQIIEVITGISAQTNLLALNAAIEAARAGEHGKGFAVVADEVRKLAEQSSESAQQISQLVAAIQDETEKAVISMENATKEVVEGIGVVETAGASFGQIQHSVSEVAGQIQEISSAVQQMSAGTEQMVRSVTEMAELTELTAAGTQEVSAATEEQLASMEEISLSSSSLANMAEELQLLIGKFKVQ
ncbi:methyl-accepting chemotaxis protein [Domibacillus antri]|uniref:Methyl-accepting chemotaxis protein n=1 Tax=Domibacillus antri TaxID=1714264 RepID=A0A1Q8Q2H6_9BACI|nr:methyl-accepting chemotaxis protein [Domibacillus antri]OLN21518.1 methyl-accepting chemotaxis protein [Domibacillus antri]